MKHLFFVILFAFSAHAADDCNSLLSDRMATSIHDLAKLRYDLDSKIALGESNLLIRGLDISFARKKAEILSTSTLSASELDSRLKAEVETIQKGELVRLESASQQTVSQNKVFDEADYRVEVVQRLKEPRRYHQISLMKDGSVMVLGGSNRSGKKLPIEIYNPATNEIRDFSTNMKSVRLEFGVFHQDDRILVLGGSEEEYLSPTAEWIDPIAGSVTPIEINVGESLMLISASDTGAVWGVWQNGKTGFVVYDALKNEVKKGSGFIHLHGSAISTLPGGKVIVSGGEENIPRGGFKDSDLIQMIDSGTAQASVVGRLKIARQNHTQITLSNGKILMIGGFSRSKGPLASIEEFDPSTGESVIIGKLSQARYLHSVVQMPDGRLVVVGGNSRRKEKSVLANTIEILEVGVSKIKVTATFGQPEGILSPQVVAISDRKVLIVGGSSLEHGSSSSISLVTLGTR